ncbi:CLUMA_CG017886, isoform A [Clunio marinus]|uniref:CLUMA_CG017886, isoform A n=1 Tax=Clunio marinus TaxID=568069 RepID=A0A1J1J1V2_9DIPT|nr:CLUMA_CG017886, isoform A [Clunio marinus]
MEVTSKLFLLFIFSFQFYNINGQNRIFVDILETDKDSTDNSTRYLCVGTIITSQYALTAASCLEVAPSRYLYIRYTLISSDTLTSTRVLSVNEVFIHPNYTIGGNKENNIAVIKAPFGELYNNADPPRTLGGLTTNSSCNLYGWNSLNGESESVTIYGPQYCNHVNPNVFCSTSPNTAACSAKIAASVMCGAGVMIDGFLISESGCESNDNRLYYHSVSEYADWINQVLSSSGRKSESIFLILSLTLMTLMYKH